MRFRLKKTVQLFIVIAGLVFYVNFVFVSWNTSPSEDQLHVKSESKHKQNNPLPPPPPKPRDNDFNLDALRFHVLDKSVNKSSFQNESIYPTEKHFEKDRILEQLAFVPPSIKARHYSDNNDPTSEMTNDEIPLKKIHLATGIGGWAIKRGRETFLEQKCQVSHCSITDKRSLMKDADVVLFDGMITANAEKPPGQVWMLYMLESPYHTPGLKKYSGLFNWTATYRHDSTIVAPYEKFVPYNESVRTQPQTKNYAAGKNKMVAWFVSNCGARNTRMEYANQLAAYIKVDIYGRCGTKKCPRHQSAKCFDMLNNDYRFYLSFENSNCRDYITEKFFVNGLKHDVIPIVMGGAPEDYARAAPPHSYIHVDDFASPKELADYLKVLATNEKLYNEYFQWKGTGNIFNTYFWCRVCALAHDVETRGDSWYDDVEAWWRGGNVCIGQKSWRDVPNRPNTIAPLARWQPRSQKTQTRRPPITERDLDGDLGLLRVPEDGR